MRFILRFSSLFKKNRRKTLLSQNDFSKEISVSFSTANRRKNDKAIPKLCKLKLFKSICIMHAIPFDIDDYLTENGKTEME